MVLSNMTCYRAYSVAGPKLWNVLTDKVKNSESLDCFKKELKTHLFEKAYVRQ